MNKNTLFQTLYLLIVVGFCAYLAYESWGQSLAYEHRIGELSEKLSMSDNIKSKSKNVLETITFGWYSGHTEDLEALNEIKLKAENHDKLAYKYTKLFIATLVLMFMLHGFLQSKISLFALLMVTVIALMTGWFAPILAIVAYQDIPVLGQSVFQFESKSIVSALQKLYDSGQTVIAVVIFAFTILTPVLKSLMMLVILFSQNLHFSTKSIKILKTIGKWSMLDVFVIAILVTYFTTKSGGATDATLQIGVYYFVTYVIASMLLTYLINIKNNVK
ncbi:MAG: paraquat-inducible protein A [Marinicella sp.]|nr:paraquat-inducible protein A [Xanthomonadales bacterium]